MIRLLRRFAVDDVDAFVAEVEPLLRQEVEALHRGDLGPRLALWSRHDPITLFGAWLTGRGWDEIEPAFRRLAATFKGSGGIAYEVLSAGASGDLGYVVGIERSVATLGDLGPTSYALRVTTILRREDGAWKVIHRHADPFDPAAAEALGAAAGSLPST
jgi:ketosteroid isomerase-like protein